MPVSPSIVDVAAGIILRPDGAFLLSGRPAGKPYAGYWEFPGGKVQSGESFLHALRRELLEELGISVEQAFPWVTRIFTYPHATVRLRFYRVMAWHGEPQPREQQELSWQFTHDVRVEPMLPANAPVLRALALPPIYAITHAAERGVDHSLSRMERALEQGVRLIQVREKKMPPELLRHFAGKSVILAHRYGAKALVNCPPRENGMKLCRETGADGIHFPAAHLMTLPCRPDIELCGASCHNEEELFRAAQLEMDFAVLGPVLPTLSHPGAVAMGWRRFAALIRECPIPVYALGGLRHEDLRTAWEHGAHGIAMIRGVPGDDAK